jgi:hypothetical protein
VNSGEEWLPILQYSPGDETDYFYGITIILEKDTGLFSWIPVQSVQLLTPSESQNINWALTYNQIVPKIPLSISDPGTYRIRLFDQGSGEVIVLDKLSPAGTILINSDAISTNTAKVILNLSCSDGGSGCAQIMFSNDNSIWSAAETYAGIKYWTLLSGAGIKTVYAKFSDNAGNWSLPVTDTIELDPTARLTAITPSVLSLK